MQTLEERIERYNELKEAYYLGEPLVSDEEFDQFEQDLLNDGWDPTVGYIIIDDSRKLKHQHKMLSLGKKQVLDDEISIELATELYNRYQRDGLILMSWKYDGLAINARYVNGIRQSMVTRGNGAIGQNVTEKFKHLIPEKLDREDWSGDIRFELVMNQRLFETKYSKNYAHSRNLVAGICNDINQNDERKYDVMLIALEAVSDNNCLWLPSTLHECWGQLSNPKWEDKTLNKEYYIINSALQLQQIYNQLYKERSEFDFGTDGLVVTSFFDNVGPLTLEFKHNDHHPHHAIAVKFKPPMLISTVTGIKWKLQKTGKLIPVVHFEPIIVDGRTIKQASGHNLEYLVTHDIVKGKQIRVILANDIIPLLKSI